MESSINPIFWEIRLTENLEFREGFGFAERVGYFAHVNARVAWRCVVNHQLGADGAWHDPLDDVVPSRINQG